LKELKMLPNLTQLSLSRRNITEADLNALRQLKNLKSLFLNHSPLTDARLKEVRESMPNVHIYR